MTDGDRKLPSKIDIDIVPYDEDDERMGRVGITLEGCTLENLGQVADDFIEGFNKGNKNE